MLRGQQEDNFIIITAQELYRKFKYQWFERLADNYRVLLFLLTPTTPWTLIKYIYGRSLLTLHLLTEHYYLIGQGVVGAGRMFLMEGGSSFYLLSIKYLIGLML